MDNFGVIEIANARTTAAPGWAYVPDNPAHSAMQAATGKGRKRAAARAKGLSLPDQSAREEARIRKDLEALDRDGSRDAAIAVPTKGRAQGKHTPNVRKILQSNKTFANHLDDFEAMQALAENSPYPSQAASREQSAKPTSSSKRKQPPAKSGSISKSSARQQQQDVVMTDALPPILAPLQLEKKEQNTADASGVVVKQEEDGDIRAPPGVSDVHALLASRVPDAPSDAELRALLAAPPLSYNEARAAWTEEDERYPMRTFCSVCGYWGKVKCVKCGTRVCALDCLDVHREECITRYGL